MIMPDSEVVIAVSPNYLDRGRPRIMGEKFYQGAGRAKNALRDRNGEYVYVKLTADILMDLYKYQNGDGKSE